MYDVLFIGPRNNKKDPSITGGAIVLFENLLEELETNHQGLRFLVVDSNKKNYGGVIVFYLSFINRLFQSGYSGVGNISLHSSRDYLLLMPIIFFFQKIFKYKVSLRKFGGEIYDTINSTNYLKRKVAKYIIQNVDFLFLESKFLVEKCEPLQSSIYWFPNVRRKEKCVYDDTTKEFNKKFVFLGQIMESKGIRSILNVKEKLPKDYVVDIYGHITDSQLKDELLISDCYKGSYNSTSVNDILKDYSVLILPTYYSGEGYPGVIIEAYMNGLPVISTNFRYIPEIVEQEKSGLLIQPKDNDELLDAILYFNTYNYKQFTSFVREYSLHFDSTQVTNTFLNVILA